MSLTWQQSIGIEESHLTNFNCHSNKPQLVNSTVINSLLRLLKQADKDGLSISIISGYRSFERQLTIWNDKWQGYQPVYSRQGRPLNILQMSEIEKYKAISLWSALPGLSRHHWGTDFDIFASKPIHDGYQVQLTPEEFLTNGPCYQLNSWLDEKIESFGFFRPYAKYQQGVSAEPWHISHINSSQEIIKNFDKESCQNHLKSSGIKCANFIDGQFEHYYQQYFSNISQPVISKE